MPRHLMKSINQAHLEIGTFEQIVSPLERELELNGLEARGEMPINTVTQQAPQQNSEKPRATIAKNQVTIKISTVNSNEKNTKAEIILIVPTITMVVPKQTPTPIIKSLTIPKRTVQIIKETEDRDLSSHPVKLVVELTTPQRNATLEQTQQTDRLHGTDDRKDKTKLNREMPRATQTVMSKLQPKLQTKNATSSLRSCN